ncbi:hypothetical protein SLS58_002835 [Diplodia intermedia]|uniref:Uncharacterized protein n=1 Tax=Diplodia intermedia TaxID=856260 RepID=A0ABR3TXR1_9PEZI
MFSQDFSQVIRDYTTRKDMMLKAGCDGICHTELIAAGFDVSCSRGSESYNIVPNITSSGSVDATTYNVGAISFFFDGVSNAETIGINVKYKGDPHCNGSFTNVKCTLRSGTITYPVTLQNDTITLDEERMTNTTDHIYGTGPPSRIMSTLGGFYSAMDQMFSSNIDLHMTGIWAIQGHGVLTNNYMSSDQHEYGNCTVASALSLSNASTPQNVNATRMYNKTTYQANYHFLIGALALILANTVVIIPLFLGWWRMGRPLSMSPLELAKVFRSPLLAESGSNEDVDGLIRSAGHKKVRYGEVTEHPLPAMTAQDMDSGSQEALVLEMHEMIEAGDNESQRRVLAMGNIASIAPPLQNARYN